MASENTGTAVADPFFVWRLNWVLLWGVNAFEHDQKESNAVTSLEEVKFLGFVHSWANFEKTQSHQKHNESVWHHFYCKINSHPLGKTVVNNSVLIYIDLSANRQIVRMSSFCEKRLINATQEAMGLFILVFRQCGLEN